MKVLMIGPDRSVHGGVSGVVNNYYEAGLDQKIELAYIGTMVDGGKAGKLIQAAKALVKFLTAVGRYEIIHVHVASDSSFYRKSIFIRIAHFCRKKIVIHQHGGSFVDFYEQGSEKRRAYVRKIFGMGDAFLVLSPSWKAFFEKVLPEKEIQVLPNAVSIPAAAEKNYGGHKLLFLGRLCRDKGIWELLSAVERLQEKYPDLTLYLGGVWEEEELRRAAEKNPEHVKWLGWIGGREKEQYLKDCDIFVLPTYFEGLPVSLLEAMAFGCAAVTTKVGGIPMVVTDGEDGILIDPKDEKALCQALDNVLQDPGLCERLGQAAREKIRREFSMEENMKQLLQVYEQVITYEKL